MAELWRLKKHVALLLHFKKEKTSFTLLVTNQTLRLLFLGNLQAKMREAENNNFNKIMG